jgi:hypothetical protein
MKKIIIDDKEIEISEKSFEALKAQLISKDTRYVPNIGEDYWLVADCGTTLYSSWDGKTVDNYRLGLGRVFKTRKEAEKHAEYLKAISKVTNYIFENGLALTDIDWEDKTQCKYCIYYYKGSFHSDFRTTTVSAEVLTWIKSQGDCYQVIEEMEDELKIIFNIK